MARTVGIGIQDFKEVITNDYFYVDKTNFIKEWWESGAPVTQIARPYGFGKTLNISMLEYFFSNKYTSEDNLFDELFIWSIEKYRNLKGGYPIIRLSFENVKADNYVLLKEKIVEELRDAYLQNSFLLDSDVLTEFDRNIFEVMLTGNVDKIDLTSVLCQLSNYLYRYYGKKVIILLDDYDTPIMEACRNGFYDELMYFMRSLFLSTFKTNVYLEKALMMGITVTSNDAICEYLNMDVITLTANKYATCFGFSEEEVFAALDECELGDEKEKVKAWYGGFSIGNNKNYYKPWSEFNYFEKREFDDYQKNNSCRMLIEKLIKESKGIMVGLTFLLQGDVISCGIDEKIDYNMLKNKENSIYSLMLANGYLRANKYQKVEEALLGKNPKYELQFSNYEAGNMISNIIRGWFKGTAGDYNDFVKSLLRGDVEAMNAYMNRVAFRTFSFFDTGNSIFGEETERFYHGFVLGLLVDLGKEYILTSNRESGFGRYDVMLEAKDKQKDSFILEFKVHNKKKESTLEDTVAAALQQIEDKQYEAELIARGVSKERIRKYGFAFEGKSVLIG